MAEIVGRIALSHAPQLLMQPDKWQALPSRLNAALPERPELEPELAEEVKAAKFQRCHDAMGVLRRQIESWDPDVLIVIGDDQKENILEDNLPPFVIYMGDEVDADMHFHYLGEKGGSQVKHYKVNFGLARWMVEGLMESGFDPAWSLSTRMETGLGHAFGRPLHFLTPTARYPIVPVMLNTYYPPAPSPRRCVEFGRALGEVVREHKGTERVVIMGSGGLSHTKIVEELDQGFIAALERNDVDYMSRMDPGELVEGTSEMRNWIATAGAGSTGARMVDYVPCYRTIHGAGCAMGFAIWD